MTAITSSAAARFVGQRVPRTEDQRLLTGQGVYVDDIVLPGMLAAAFVRSQVARGKIVNIDSSAARALPGVHAVYTVADLAPFMLPLPRLYASLSAAIPASLPLAQGDVRYAGDPLAIVIADNRYLAEDGAGLVTVTYETETPVITMPAALAGKPVHADLQSNLAEELRRDDPGLDEIFAQAAHVVTGTIRHQRQAHVPMETRGAVVSAKGNEVTVYVSCQSPQMAAHYLKQAFAMPDTNFRVIAKDVGGAFGLKVQPWREEVAVVAAGMLMRRPLKWIEDRLENLTTANQAREQEVTVRLAFDAGAILLGADIDYLCNIGAYAHGISANGLAMSMFPGPYRLPRYRFRARAVFSNTCGEAAYRGPWMIESLARETMLEQAAKQIGIDPVELRRRNLITAAEQPYTMLTEMVLDRITPHETLDLTLAKLDLPAFRASQAKARAQGRYLGLGFSVYAEPTTMAFGGVLASDIADIRIDPGGKATVIVSTHSQGHGTQTTIAQVVADQLGFAMRDVTVLEDDSSRGGFGPGAGGSRQAVSGGGAARVAAATLAAKMKVIAAHVLNATAETVEIIDGAVRIQGVTEMSMTVKELAEIAYFTPERLPPGMESGLQASYRYRPPPIVFSNAAHACVVEVDVETGITKVLRWIACEDCGVLINPAIVEGQIAGGVVQAIGGVLFEHASYDAAGNSTAATFKDYLIPGIHDVPEIEFGHIITPSASEGGFKGVGEGGAIVGPAAVVNAVADALAPFGVSCLDLPLTPARVLALLENAKT
jgi:carbon-monoxide dehydrogenase large subunit